MAEINQPNVVVGSEAPDYVQNLASDINDGIGRLNAGLQSSFADITTDVTTLQTDVATLQADVTALEASVVTPGTSVKVTYNARGQITAGSATALAADISDFDTQVRTSSLDQMTIPAADLDANTHKIINLAAPVNPNDAARKTDVDTANHFSSITGATFTKVTVSNFGVVTAGTTLVAADIPTLTAAKISDFDTQVRTSTLSQMAAPGADVSLNSKKITSLADAAAATDALNRQTGDGRYVLRAGDSINAKIRFGQNSSDDPAGTATHGGIFYGAASDAYISLSRSTLPSILQNVSADAYLQLFYRSGALHGGISITTGGTTFDTVSDYRLKEDLEPMIAPLDRLNALRPLSFNWIADTQRTSKTDGFLANEVQAIVPDAVRGVMNDAVPQMIDHSKLVPLLIGAVQQLSAKVELLQKQVGV